MKKTLLALFWLLAFFLGAGMLFNLSNPDAVREYQAKRAERVETRQATPAEAEQLVYIAIAQDQIKETLRDPDSVRWGRVALMEGPDHVVCAELHARNGFGGYAAQRFVVLPLGQVTATESAWRGHCAGRKIIETI